MLYGALSEPEPCAGKLACTVLRGLSDGDITQLPDQRLFDYEQRQGSVNLAIVALERTMYNPIAI